MCEKLRELYPEDRSPDEMFSLHFPDAVVVNRLTQLAADGTGVCEKCGTRSVLWKCRVCGHDNRPAAKA